MPFTIFPIVFKISAKSAPPMVLILHSGAALRRECVPMAKASSMSSWSKPFPIATEVTLDGPISKFLSRHPSESHTLHVPSALPEAKWRPLGDGASELMRSPRIKSSRLCRTKVLATTPVGNTRLRPTATELPSKMAASISWRGGRRSWSRCSV